MTRRARDSPIKSANGTSRSEPNRAVSPYRMIVLTWATSYSFHAASCGRSAR